jgi:hypothetical protein
MAGLSVHCGMLPFCAAEVELGSNEAAEQAPCHPAGNPAHLCVDEVLAVQLLFAGGRVAGEADACDEGEMGVRGGGTLQALH